MSVRAKKHLGQHFLTSQEIASKTADLLDYQKPDVILEIGPGMGMLTQYLLDKTEKLWVVEIDDESVKFLDSHFQGLENRILNSDFLKMDLKSVFPGKSISIIGNFPYNISSQIVFKTLENREIIPEFAGMFQKEVAHRICSKEGSKIYGILSVLVQAFYHADYVFTIPPSVFNPPPKVDSAVLKLVRKENFHIGCDEKLFFQVVKGAFNQRRKTLRNSLKNFNLSDKLKANSIFGMRPEQLDVNSFIELTSAIEQDLKDQQLGGNQE